MSRRAKRKGDGQRAWHERQRKLGKFLKRRLRAVDVTFDIAALKERYEASMATEDLMSSIPRGDEDEKEKH
jgi:hypothetical protein